MPELVLFPDTDNIAIRILEIGLPQHGFSGLWIGTEIPAKAPTQFIRCFTLPGREICRRTIWCQVVTQVYDVKGKEERCSRLARVCSALLRAAPETVVDGEQWITEPCEQQAVFPTEDPELPGRPRYQANNTWTVQSQVSS